MNQFYNPQGFQPYSGAPGKPPGAQGQPFYPGQQGFPPAGAGNGGFPPASSGGLPPAGPGGFPPAGAGAAPMQQNGPAAQVPGMLPIEQSYIENILRLNKGKLVHLFATFEGSTQWNSKEFVGIIEAAGRDHVILSDPQVGTRFLIPMVALDYVTFAEEIEYEYPFGAGPSLSTFPPR